jgi:hypothetical protein
MPPKKNAPAPEKKDSGLLAMLAPLLVEGAHAQHLPATFHHNKAVCALASDSKLSVVETVKSDPAFAKHLQASVRFTEQEMGILLRNLVPCKACRRTSLKRLVASKAGGCLQLLPGLGLRFLAEDGVWVPEGEVQPQSSQSPSAGKGVRAATGASSSGTSLLPSLEGVDTNASLHLVLQHEPPGPTGISPTSVDAVSSAGKTLAIDSWFGNILASSNSEGTSESRNYDAVEPYWKGL